MEKSPLSTYTANKPCFRPLPLEQCLLKMWANKTAENKRTRAFKLKLSIKKNTSGLGLISYSHQIAQVNLLVKFKKSMVQCLV